MTKRALVRGVSLVLAVLGPAVAATADDAVIDLRTLIPGVLDAPVYHTDGTNRLSGDRYFAEFLAGPDPASLVSIGVRLTFGVNEWAGYCSAGDPTVPDPVVLPFAQAGERVWFQMRAWEPASGYSIPEIFPPNRFSGQSEVFSLVVSNTPTPLIGLKSFRFDPARIQLSRQGDQLVLRWSAGDGTVNYDVEVASSLDGPSSWQSSGLSPVAERVDIPGFPSTWQANWVLTTPFTGPGTFYRLRLLDP